MSRLERIGLGFQELRAVARVLPIVPRLLPSSTWNVSRLLDLHVKRRPGAIALIFEGRRFTWREVDENVNRWANALRAMGVQKGNSVPLLMDNRPEYLFAVTALSRIGAVSALINTNVSGIALGHAIRIASPTHMIVGTEHGQKLRTMLMQEAAFDALEPSKFYEQRDDSASESSEFASLDALLDEQTTDRPSDLPVTTAKDLMCFIYTSGTTGLPKAAIINNGKFLSAGILFSKLILNATPSDVIYMTLPLYHSTGMFAGWSNCLQSGAAMALRRRFSASRCWDEIAETGSTVFIYIGELCRYLLNQPPCEAETRHRLRVAAGNGLRPDIWESFMERFRIPRIGEFYGATEGNGPLVNITGEVGKIGRLRGGIAVLRSEVETGEPIRNADGFCDVVAEGATGLLVCKITGVLSFDGYVDRGASEKKIMHDVFEKGDHYFNTGDLVGLGDNGWLTFVDRVGDTFRWKGENVSTNEVAETLNGASGVLESNVYGVKVPGTDGRAGMASLNVDQGFSVEALAKFVQDSLPNFQRPYFIRVQSEMRITGTFKHQKVDYRDEGFDPSRVEDPLYLLDEGKYVPLDRALYDAIQRGDHKLR